MYQLDEELCDGGIVVTSSNNGAVENISKELPMSKAVEPYANEIEYFKQVAETCVSEGNWGLVSAVLGKKENRNNLTSRIWWNKEVNDLQKTLKSTKPEDLPDWKSTVSDFNQKIKEVANEKEKLEIAKSQYEDYIKLSKRRSDHHQKIEALQKIIRAEESKLESNSDKLEELNQTKKDYLSELSILKSNKPNFFVYWFSRKIRREFKKSLNNLFKSYNETSQAYENL
jgi:chromosome segregation ATPase